MYLKWNLRMALLLAAVLLASGLAVSAQEIFWSENNVNRSAIATHKTVARQSFPREFRLYDLDLEPMKQRLMSVVDSRMSPRSTVISLPNADGQIEQFEVYEASNFEPDLQAQFPEIRAFSGRGITDRYATLKMSISRQAIQTMVFRTDKDNEFIEPYSQDQTVYAVFRTHREPGELPWACSTEEKKMFAGWNTQVFRAADTESNTGEVKTMRLAQSCNGEYSNFFGATSSAQVANVLAAFNNTLTRANGVYEKDLAIHLNLIANTTAVIYYDPATDPYTSLSNWNSQLQAALTANIGEANYDIGHMFGASGGGGNAGCIGCVCVDGQKGRGITSPADSIPMGDNFDIDYVVHEVGHQMGANHSFSWSNEGTGVNKEVGSGITIMGYAGITNQDVAPHSIDVFHEANIDQIQANMAPKVCPVTTVMTANHPPVVANLTNYTIPITTPFALTGSATDPENDPLTYNWEQNDNTTTTGNASVASPTKLTGPNWLTFPSTASPTRTFPRLSTILAGLFVTPTLPGGDAIANIEALSSVGRTLNFRLTVRDNRPYVPSSTIGQTQFKDMTVTVSPTAGPFKVTTPNTGLSWQAGLQTVTWDVANTTLAPISTGNVNILYSTDGGTTFPTTLATNTANDGTQQVTIPTGNTTTARIKVEAVGNIYFDISDANFTVTGIALPPKSRADFDADGKTDVSIFRPTSGDWWLNRSTAGIGGVNWGLAGDIVTPGDFDNDAKTDIAVWRPSTGTFFILNSQTNTVTMPVIGASGDIPVIGDFDGDNRSDAAVYNTTTATWTYAPSAGGAQVNTVYGGSGFRPVSARFDNDAKSDYVLFNPTNGNWMVKYSSNNQTLNFNFGVAGDTQVVADYDGDNIDDIAVFRQSSGSWHIIRSTGGLLNAAWGSPGDIPVPGDYDGDNSDDLAIYRGSGQWWILRSTAGAIVQGWGLVADKPVPNAYLP